MKQFTDHMLEQMQQDNTAMMNSQLAAEYENMILASDQMFGRDVLDEKGDVIMRSDSPISPAEDPRYSAEGSRPLGLNPTARERQSSATFHEMQRKRWETKAIDARARGDEKGRHDALKQACMSLTSYYDALKQPVPTDVVCSK